MFSRFNYFLVLVILVRLTKVSFNYSNQFLVFILLGGFCFLNFITVSPLVFFITFEFIMIPICFYILVWGLNPERILSVQYFLVYMGICSFPLLLNIVFSLLYLRKNILSLFWFLALLVKSPIYFLHQWLPLAHVESPTSGSIFLASVLLKLSLSGFLVLGLFSSLFIRGVKFLFNFLLAGVLIVSVLSKFQSDIKVLIAYSSVCHMTFGLYLLVFPSSFSILCLILLGFSHAFSSSVLFKFCGEAFNFRYTRRIGVLRGLLRYKTFYLFLLFSILASNYSLPFRLSFFREIFVFGVLFKNLKVFIGFILIFSFFLIGCYKIILYLNLQSFGGGAHIPLSVVFLGKNFFLVCRVFLVFLLSSFLGVSISNIIKYNKLLTCKSISLLFDRAYLKSTLAFKNKIFLKFWFSFRSDFGYSASHWFTISLYFY